ncbi:anti-anti-sigma regulatory factor (antagonist of anti-sigma factor) [Mycobacterium sp. JS623]|uniref:STAS domain-containing protein n=1 Tax=Mycobacterium sp. JS623 TaxID=212767 RepID=UPI0002A55481|nr:STAS domain-containing protein [Mycobacterium sp. JS623]AGB26600.1 anti-anti-sigma regulatory factor (antagonist of anti-sigma factor) [Mycobacterium sp. JS623]
MNNPAEGQQTQTRSVTVDVKRSSTNKSVIYVGGELLEGATATMRRVVADELNRSPALLVVDLSGVLRVDTEGIDVLVSAATQAGESDISLCLVGVHGHPAGTALADADLLELFEIYTAESDT